MHHPCSFFFPSVLYFSVHRYENGSFWSHLKESASSSVGSGAGQGYNINIPWNKVYNLQLNHAYYLTAHVNISAPVP